MRPLDFVRIALFDLRSSKLRSLLTGLGIIIGVGSVTLLLSLGEGVRARVGTTFTDLGSTRIFAGPLQTGTGPGASTITLADAEAVAALPGVLDAAPVLTLTQLVTGASDGIRMPVVGTTPPYFAVTAEEFIAGGPFDDGGAVLDESAVASLLGVDLAPAGALGRTVRVAGADYRVAGVVKDPAFGGGGGFGDGGGARNGTAFIPIAPLMAATGQTYANQLQLRAADPTKVEEVRLAVRDLLQARHGLLDVAVISLARLLDRVNEAIAVITGFLAALAAISLLVGGIGIMNIMLAVVAERTREIGIIRALGATRRAVIGQFLTEAVFISLLGGAIGLLLALAGSLLVEAVTDVPAIVSPGIVGLALGVSTVIGVIFGVLPAYRAARLDPIRALRHD